MVIQIDVNRGCIYNLELDQGRSVGKSKFTRNRKIEGVGGAKRCPLTLFETMCWQLELLRNISNLGRYNF